MPPLIPLHPPCILQPPVQPLYCCCCCCCCFPEPSPPLLLLLQGVMAQCRHALRPDGLFLAAMFGGHTLQVRRRRSMQHRSCACRLCNASTCNPRWLVPPPLSHPHTPPLPPKHTSPPPPPTHTRTHIQELRIACTVAQQEREGGVSPRVSPLAQVRDAGNLLTRAGLAIPAVDVDDIQVHYRDATHLVQHLRRGGRWGAVGAVGWGPRGWWGVGGGGPGGGGGRGWRVGKCGLGGRGG